MTPEQFTYWLQGFLELSNTKTMDEAQVQILKDHISLVLTKKTPERQAVSPPLTQPLLPIHPPYFDPFPPFPPGQIYCSDGNIEKAINPIDPYIKTYLTC